MTGLCIIWYCVSYLPRGMKLPLPKRIGRLLIDLIQRRSSWTWVIYDLPSTVYQDIEFSVFTIHMLKSRILIATFN